MAAMTGQTKKSATYRKADFITTKCMSRDVLGRLVQKK